MTIEGGCYCGAVRYSADGEIRFKGQCHCRECQYITGGHPVVVMGMPADDFRYTRGEPKSFTRSDLESPVIREFCSDCGTHLTTRAPGLPDTVIVKVGTLDDPAVFGAPEIAIWLDDKQSFHHVPEGIPTFPGFPPRE